MTRSPAGPNPAQWGRREPVSFGTGCTGDCVSSRPSDGPGSHVPAALEEIRERNTHRQSASNPYGRRRFVNFVVLDASEPYFTKSELRLRIPELLAKPVNRPVEWNSARGMRRIQVDSLVSLEACKYNKPTAHSGTIRCKTGKSAAVF